MTFHCLWSPKLPPKGRCRSPGFPLQAASAALATVMQNPRALTLGVCTKQRPQSWGGQWEGWMHQSHLNTGCRFFTLHSTPFTLPFPGGYKYFLGEPSRPGHAGGCRDALLQQGALAQKPALGQHLATGVGHV